MADKKTRDKVENLKPTHRRTASPAKHELVKEGDLWFIKKGSDKFGPYPKGSLEGYVKKLKNLGRI